MDLNQVIMIGRLTRDPELSYTPSGNAVCNFSLAVNGYKKNDVSFFNIQAWNKIAENVNNYMKKGSKVCVEGSLRQDRWEKDGQKFNRVLVNARNVYFLDSKNSNGKIQGNENYQQNKRDIDRTFNNDYSKDIPY